MREEELIEQLIKIMDKIDMNETGMEMKFNEELKRYNKFNQGVLGIKDKTAKHQEIDMRTYGKYVLQHGSNEEKRELMGCFRSKIIVTNQIVTIL